MVELDHVDMLAEAVALYRTVWRTDTRAAPVNSDVLRALSHAGSYVVGAYDDSGRMVAASTAFLATGHGDLHSHITGVLASARGRDVGAALKLHQRAWALDRGLSTISWTFDPLLRRNAWFNVSKLGAALTDYLVDFYGPMDDAQNGGDASDRVVAVWDLLGPRARAFAAGEQALPSVPGDAAVLLREDHTGAPARMEGRAGARAVLVQVPQDAQQLRQDRPELARAWRVAVRATLVPLLTGGWTATALTRDGWYVLEENP